jgi:hypothetical protein
VGLSLGVVAGVAAMVGLSLTEVLAFNRVFWPLLGGLVAGVASNDSPNNGGLAEFLSALTGGLIALAFLSGFTSFGDDMFFSGGIFEEGIIILSLYLAIFGFMGGAIGGMLADILREYV